MKTSLSRLALGAGFVLLAATQIVAAEFDQRLSNLSTRTLVGTGANVAVVGFVIGPGYSKNVLIRAVGPGLGVFGVPGTISDPQIDLFDSAGRKFVSNDNWATIASNATAANVATAGTFTSVGAFGL